jgi:hypothetical protein
MKKKTALRKKGGTSNGGMMYRKVKHYFGIFKHSETRNAAYARIGYVRQTERIHARAFFTAHPDYSYCRAELVDLLTLPINHVTRVVRELLDENFIEVSGRRINPRSGVSVEVVRLKQKGSGNETE